MAPPEIVPPHRGQTPWRTAAGARRRWVLIVCDVVPGHRSAGEVRLAKLAGLLAEEEGVALVALDRHLDDPDGDRIEALRAAGVDVLDVGGPTALRAALVVRRYDLVIVEFWHVAERALPVVRSRQPWALVAVDTVDLHFLREERGTLVGYASPPGTDDRKRRELEVYEAADVRIFTSAAERDRYSSLTGATEGDVVVSTIVRSAPRQIRTRSPLVVFVGNFWHAPNVDGVRWFAERVWPAVRAAVPAARFAVAGSRIGPDVQRLGEVEGVEVRGFVADLSPLYDDASVVVAPLRFGAGVKGKVTEALAAGLPMVVSSVAAEGLDLTDEADLLVADEAEDFATKLVRLLTDPDAGAVLGRHGQATIEARCGPAPARAALRALMAEAASAPSARRSQWWVRSLPDRVWTRVRPAVAAAARVIRRRAGRPTS